jgi:hypothetical protein
MNRSEWIAFSFIAKGDLDEALVCLRGWLWLFFLSTQKYIKIMYFFNFLKIIFDINVLK